MQNEPTTIGDSNTNLSLNIENEKLEKKFNIVFKKILSILKPSLIDFVITLISFVLVLAFVKQLGYALLAGLLTYLFTVFLLKPIFKNKFKIKMNLPLLVKNRENTTLLPTTSKSAIFVCQKNKLFAIALLKIEWSKNFLPLNQIWDFLEKESIEIQDCKEGCYLIIRKNSILKNKNNLQEITTKLIKEIEKTILFTKKRFELDNENVQLQLVKGQEIILAILNLGLQPQKFKVYYEMSDDELERVKESALNL